jgi:hypothetical protein
MIFDHFNGSGKRALYGVVFDTFKETFRIDEGKMKKCILEQEA